MKARSRKTHSTSLTVTPAGGSTLSHRASTYLAALLPTGWDRYFTARTAGARVGLSIRCPECSTTPPSTLTGYQRWRWLTVHVAEHRGTMKVVGAKSVTKKLVTRKQA